MREIKFRFWNQISRRFVSTDGHAILGNGKLLGYDYEIFSWDKDGASFKDTCIIAQQFIGFYDKDGNEIYEGDILSTYNNNLNFIVAYGLYEDSECCNHIGFYTHAAGQDFYKTEIGNLDNYRIIGNIFENPELLK